MTDITELAQQELAQLRAELSNQAIGSKDHLRKIALSLVDKLEKYRDREIRWLALSDEKSKIITDQEEALEKAQTKAVEQGRTSCELFDEVTTLRQRIAELEEAQSMHESDTLMLCRQFDELAASMGWSSELAMQQGVSQLEYARSLKERIAELESRTVTVKLPKDHVEDADLFGWGVVVVPLEALKEACADAGVTVEITNADIKCEAE
jgi:multidrug efflux pump subunit AcrA (membrane-fusion protein)